MKSYYFLIIYQIRNFSHKFLYNNTNIYRSYNVKFEYQWKSLPTEIVLIKNFNFAFIFDSKCAFLSK